MAAVRDAQAAVRLAAVGAGLRTGLLDLLQRSPATAPELAALGGWSDKDLLVGLLHVLSELGLVRESDGLWQLTRRGLLTLEDDVVRATYEGFSDYHVGLYEQIDRQMAGGPARRDVAEKGEVIARLSRAMDPFVLDALDKELAQRRAHRILDIGCGTGSHLTHMLKREPFASGVGIESDAAAAAMARSTLDAARLSDRAEVVEGDLRDVLDVLDTAEGFDFVLMANVVYYLPVEERVPVLRAVAEQIEAGGSLMVVTTALTDSVFSRHFDLLLRAQEGDMGLPDIDVLAEQLRAAGLTPGRARRIAVGEPLTALVGTKA